MTESAKFFTTSGEKISELKLPFGHSDHLELSLAGRIPEGTFKIIIDKYLEFIYGNRQAIVAALQAQFPDRAESYSVEMPTDDKISMYILRLLRRGLIPNYGFKPDGILRVADQPYDPNREKEGLKFLNRAVDIIPTDHVNTLGAEIIGKYAEVYGVLPNGDLEVAVWNVGKKGPFILKVTDVKLAPGEVYRF